MAARRNPEERRITHSFGDEGRVAANYHVVDAVAG
jgi:hypothetical protein